MVVSAGRAGGLVGCGVLAGNAVCKLVLAMLAFVSVCSELDHVV